MILVLDDNIDDLELIGHHFKKNGIVDFKLFDNDKEFLKEINEEVVVVIIDHQIGSLKTGLTVMKDVIEKNPVCYPIVVSGNDNPRIIMEYLNSDAFRYVLKNDFNYLDTIVVFVNQAKDRINKIVNYLKNG